MGRESRARHKRRPDPPMEPYGETTRYIVSAPEAIESDPEMASLIVCVGMAINALGFQLSSLRHAAARGRTTVYWERDVVLSFATSCAFAYEAVRFTSQNLAKLRPLANLSGCPADVMANIGKICGGAHPAWPLMTTNRNQLTFHWDPQAIMPTVRAFARNKRIVWIEGSQPEQGDGSIHRLALAVLNHAFNGSSDLATPDEVRQRVSEARDLVIDLMKTLIGFLTHCTDGYLQSINAKALSAR